MNVCCSALSALGDLRAQRQVFLHVLVVASGKVGSFLGVSQEQEFLGIKRVL